MEALLKPFVEVSGRAVTPSTHVIARLLAADPTALLEAPLKFAVFELPDSWIDPAAACASHGKVTFTDLGRDAAACGEIAAASLGVREVKS